ncbi:glutathione gamma-glutamylcysteinyltransferase 1-like isoform X2 [Syzygium oleosum]|uniref:glutathione gamma-glutamylcysteinyltransferase 1-like isoform X2 n=1 Tax=Syzygium oleosum TaxID=219896 RepID=UPI0024BA924E|nr:glutathione gamma-glutamylcysteinyltransferase 1-like isoform X2 [Syzygium oleosum]
MATAGLYRRVLPSPPATDFASDEGKKLFVEAIQAGTMEGFYKLISYFQTQSEPAYCGLASLSMVLNALAIDPGRKWKGPWRWFDESMLDCCEPLEKVKAEGISFGKLVCLGQCAGAEVEAFRTSQTTVDHFRQFVKRCSVSDNCHVVSSYHRGAFKQTGTGHFSPIGGYHAGSDMVLILDVARFKYPPHWVPLTLLWEAMDTVDKTTGEKRGFMLISRPKRDPGLLYTLSCKHESWVGVAKYLMDDVPHLLKSKDVKDINGILSILLASLPSDFGKFIQWIAEVRRERDGGIGISEEEKRRLAIREELLKQVQDTGFFKHIVNFLSSTSCCRRVPAFGGNENLHEIAASVCCQGAEILSGKSGTSSCSCCRETCFEFVNADGHKTVMVLSATIVNGKNEEKVDMLVPQSLMELCCGAPDPNHCISTQPVGSDILTLLLLMLPPQTWCGIKDEKLLEEVQSLVSKDNLPAMLQEEVLHLRRQLYLLNKRQENKCIKQEPLTVC